MNLHFEQQLEADLEALVNAQRTDGQTHFADRGHCERVQAALERVLVSADDLQTYDRLLSQICGDRIQYLDELPEAIVERIVEQGIGQLEPEWLARLVLDPVWVRMLSDEIAKRFPEAWWEAMHRDGKRILAEQGFSEFPLKAAIARAVEEVREAATLTVELLPDSPIYLVLPSRALLSEFAIERRKSESGMNIVLGSSQSGNLDDVKFEIPIDGVTLASLPWLRSDKIEIRLEPEENDQSVGRFVASVASVDVVQANGLCLKIVLVTGSGLKQEAILSADFRTAPFEGEPLPADASLIAVSECSVREETNVE